MRTWGPIGGSPGWSPSPRAASPRSSPRSALYRRLHDRAARRPRRRRGVIVSVRKGLIEVDDHSQIARKDHVEQIERQLDQMREMAMAITQEMIEDEEGDRMGPLVEWRTR